MAGVFGFAFGALIEGGGQPSQAVSGEPATTPTPAPSRMRPALPTPTASARDRPSPDYGFADTVVAESGVRFLVFDRADILVGAAATAEAARNGATVDPDGGYYVRNNNKRKRRLRLAESVRIRGGTALGGSGVSGRDMSVEEFTTALRNADAPVPVVLTYDAEGRVVTLAEAVLP
jgi:hypothetical protein